VFLVGAGPGAPDLITLRAARALAAADVVLIDQLANRELLAHCRAGVKVIAVGKRAGCRSTPQAFIQRLMVRYARQGQVVVRLKGGDPLVFGRGGEELEYLRAQGIDAEVVSGLTSGLAVPACLGIPVTHRGLARGVTLLTAHSHDGSEADWAHLARARTTLVIYMGLRHIEQVTTQLIANGLCARTPAAVIEQGTLKSQRHVIAPLQELAQAARDQAMEAPALIVIGDVVALARQSAATTPIRSYSAIA
jgi:uroporphyrin-III C-methyltransferase